MSQAAELASREERKPYVRFERMSVEDAAATLAAGRYVAKDVDYVLITPPYSKDVFKQKVKNWFEQVCFCFLPRICSFVVAWMCAATPDQPDNASET